MAYLHQFGKVRVLYFIIHFTKSRFDKNMSMWRAKSAKYPNFHATSEASPGSMLLGPHLWTIHNDSSFCSTGGTYTR